ncbi:GH1 family beta-glucosidase [Streptomyces sp. NPDC097595]|uniref:GH1 family beta-glucosidase n=1 Tax=Streptomyces sp. NPDC097595 TaxID=3366090 RepID=UPI00380EE189
MVNTFDPIAPVAVPGLPDRFLWGVATSAYQIEGAAAEDGRTDSIWDTFTREPGAVADRSSGATAADHYHRMPQDVAMIADLGVDVYRFSVSWPRVQPGGTGPVNPRGIAFYDRLVDELLGRGVRPWLTLYHWDLPQELEDAGGWPARDTAHRFADYAALVHEALGDRVSDWSTLNEPGVAAVCGYANASHAPGRRDFAASLDATHHLLLAHGLAAGRLRENATAPIEVGITLDLADDVAASTRPEDQEALRRWDGFSNCLFLDPLLRGSYPEDVVGRLARTGHRLPVEDGDLELIAAPVDVLGVNYYRYDTVAATGQPAGEAGYEQGIRMVDTGLPRTAMGWNIVPDGLERILLRLSREYPGTPLVVTENGAAFDDTVAGDGAVHDVRRTAYLRDHIAAVARARAAGADVRGYFAWSLMDNFEWAEGYRKRFGLIRVDYATQQRIIKDSAHWYRETIRLSRGDRGR